MTNTTTVCGHVTDNGQGIVWACVAAPHPDRPTNHYMRVDELASRRATKRLLEVANGLG
jgi:hypothetical protein